MNRGLIEGKTLARIAACAVQWKYHSHSNIKKVTRNTIIGTTHEDYILDLAFNRFEKATELGGSLLGAKLIAAAETADNDFSSIRKAIHVELNECLRNFGRPSDEHE